MSYLPSSSQAVTAPRRSIYLAAAASVLFVASGFSWVSRVDARSRAHSAASGEVNAFFSKRFPSTPSVADIAGYNDAQRLEGDNADDYGPDARLYVSPALASVSRADFRAADGAFVALLEVDGEPTTGTMPKTYSKLKIQDSKTTRWYCVILKLDTSRPSDPWDGFLTDATPASGSCAAPGSSGSRRLDAAADPEHGDDPATADDFPAVARFGEDNSAKPNPSIGVKCLDAWCELGHKVGGNKPPSHPRKNKREGRVKGWHDEQMVAVPSAGKPKRAITATVTPVPGLAKLQIAASPIGAKVATVWLSNKPAAGTKYDTWGLTKGETDVWVRLEGGKWAAQFVAPGATPGPSTKKFVISRVQHSSGPAVPGIARWIWSDTDEDIWVACDQGCCDITMGLLGP